MTRYDRGDTFGEALACCTTQCHSQLHKEREADNDRSDREAAASARDSGGVKLASGEVEDCRQVVRNISRKGSSCESEG